MRVEFFIPHTVQAKQADRSRIATKGNGQQFVHHYQPSKVTENADTLASLCAPHVPPQPLRGPVRLELTVHYPWRKSEPKKNRATAKPKDTQPDHEQLSKQLCDVFEAMGFVTNDAQFADTRVRKFWSDSPGVQVFMEEIQ